MAKTQSMAKNTTKAAKKKGKQAMAATVSPSSEPKGGGSPVSLLEEPPISQTAETTGGNLGIQLEEIQFGDLSAPAGDIVPPMNITEQKAEEVKETGQGNPRPWRELFAGNMNSENGLKLEMVGSEGDEIFVTLEEQEPELKLWEFSLFAYVLGQEIPVPVMVNFLKNRWKGLNQPTVIKFEYGFIIRFECECDMKQALSRGTPFFYSKPVILSKWKGSQEAYDSITTVPVWTQLPKLPIGLWGTSTLSKIASKVGVPQHTDDMTTKKLRLDYARILVDVELGSELPQELKIKIEGSGKVLTQPVKYEWLPMKCSRCGKWGHRECAKPVSQVWQPKRKVPEEARLKDEQAQSSMGNKQEIQKSPTVQHPLSQQGGLFPLKVGGRDRRRNGKR